MAALTRNRQGPERVPETIHPLPDSDHNDVEKRGVALFHALKRDPPMRSRGSADRDYSRRRALEWHGVKCRPRPVSSETYLPSYRP